MPVRIAVPRESADGESRVAFTPDAVSRVDSEHVRIAVESGAGRGAAIPDEAYREAGVEVVEGLDELLAPADVVLKVAPPGPRGDDIHEVDLLAEGTVLVCFLRPRGNAPLLARLARRGVTALALELVPRITRAQSMDALSSQSNLAGYKAAIIGAHSLRKIYPLLMTAAGTLSPARVLVLGAGVAGLQAIATAKRLGAEVWGYDIRAAVKEQVESLGARFVELEEDTPGDVETAGGYAKELAEEEQARRRALLADQVARADVVITTALVPGRPAPLLVTEEMVEAMRPGSVIVDLAGEAGGNCALSTPGETVVARGVTIHAPLNLPSTLAFHASRLLARNMSAILDPMLADGRIEVDLEDEVVAACCVTHAGEVRFEE